MKASFILEAHVSADADPWQCREDLIAVLKEMGLDFTLKGPSLAKITVPNPTLYVDGGVKAKLKLGGYGWVLLSPDGIATEGSGTVIPATNNVAELKALIVGLEAITEPSIVTVYTDSQYVQRGFMWRLEAWQENGWIGSTGNPVANVPYWEELLVLKKRHEVDVRWVKGHSGNPFNERCDYLATMAMMDHPLAKGSKPPKGKKHAGSSKP